MVVKIRIADPLLGDKPLTLSTVEAADKLNQLLQKDFVVAVNGEVVREKATLSDGDEVLAYPPIQGG